MFASNGINTLQITNERQSVIAETLLAQNNHFTWFVVGSYGTIVIRPSTACNIRPRIGIPCCNSFCSKPTSERAFRPRTDKAKLILRPWTRSLERISTNEWLTQKNIFMNWIVTMNETDAHYHHDTRTNGFHDLFCPNAMPSTNQPMTQFDMGKWIIYDSNVDWCLSLYRVSYRRMTTTSCTWFETLQSWKYFYSNERQTKTRN